MASIALLSYVNASHLSEAPLEKANTECTGTFDISETGSVDKIQCWTLCKADETCNTAYWFNNNCDLFTSNALCVEAAKNNRIVMVDDPTYVGCETFLTDNGSRSAAIQVNYVDGGADLTLLHTDIFVVENPAQNGCAYSTVVTPSCNWGDTCGDATTITDTTNFSVTSTTDPYTLSYSQSNKDGYAATSICLQCTSTNSEFASFVDTFTFTIEQLALVCDTLLVPNAQNSYSYDYVNGGAG